jgi:type I restriction enzyme, S subunit
MQLSDVCELIVDCEHKTAPTQNVGYPSIRTPNIGRGYFILDSVNRVSEDTYRLWTRRAVPQAGDLIMAREAPVGNIAMVPSGLHPCLGQRTLLIRPNQNKADSRYLAYLLLGPVVQAMIYGLANGATVPHLNMEDVRSLRIPDLPELSVQKKVAGVLSAYDDLIENNLRRVWILEEMARALYREWFIELKVPDSGASPNDWRKTPFIDCVEVNPKVAVARGGEKPFVSMGALSNDSMIVGEFEQRTGNSGSKFQNGDTLFARITPCLENGKTGFVQFLPDDRAVAFGSTEFIVLRSKTLTPEFVYLLARTDEFRGTAIKSMSGASGRQRVQERCFDNVSVVHPPAEILARFTEVVAPMFRLVHQLHLRSLNLRATRDLLLPRLVSGQLSLTKVRGEFAVLVQPAAHLG